MKLSELKSYDKSGVFTLAAALIYSGIKHNETDFLSYSDYGSGLLSFAEERSGRSFEQMKEAVKGTFSTKNLDVEVFKEEAKHSSLKELADKYNCSQQLLRGFCQCHDIEYIKIRKTECKRLNDELVEKLKKFNGRYSVYEMAQITHRSTTTIKALCKSYNIPQRESK